MAEASSDAAEAELHSRVAAAGGDVDERRDAADCLGSAGSFSSLNFAAHAILLMEDAEEAGNHHGADVDARAAGQADSYSTPPQDEVKFTASEVGSFQSCALEEARTGVQEPPREGLAVTHPLKHSSMPSSDSQSGEARHLTLHSNT